MNQTHRRDIAFASIGVLVILLLTIGLPLVRAVFLAPYGAHFRPLSSGVDYQFSLGMDFNRIEVRAHEVYLDGFLFQFSAPNGCGRCLGVAPLMYTLVGVLDANDAVAWRSTWANQTPVWFNVTGLAPNTLYSFVMDGQQQDTVMTNATGHLEQKFPNWFGEATHDFRYQPLTGFHVSFNDLLLIILIIAYAAFLILSFVFHEPLLGVGAGIVGVLIAVLVFRRTGDAIISGIVLLLLGIFVVVWELLVFFHRDVTDRRRDRK